MLAAISLVASSVMTVTFSPGLYPQAYVDRVAGAGSKFRIERKRIELAVGLTDRKAHYPTFLAEAVTGVSVKPTSVSSMM